MSKTVFLLGAGASVDAGVPVMKDFWNVARRNWKIGNLRNYNEDFERVERALIALQETQSYTNIDYSNLESFVTSIEMAALLDKLPNFEPDEIDELIKSIKNVIVATIEEVLKFRVDGDGVITPPRGYDDFTVLLSLLDKKADPAHDISVLTFNYDIGLDYSLALS